MPARQGRGARDNPAGRFETVEYQEDPRELDEDDRRQVTTQIIRDHTKSALAKNDSPDIPFTYSVNPYRGCEHGCTYCYARPSHEYLGYSAGLDFETKIVIKPHIAEHLSRAFQKESWTSQAVCMSGNTDPYQPIERKFELSRSCLEVFLEHRNPVSIITKGGNILRDLDLLSEMAERKLVRAAISVTSLKPEIARAMEPRAAGPALRLKAIEKLSEAGVPVTVMTAPVVPGLTDEEVPRILEAAAERGAMNAGYVLLRLPGTVEGIFVDWLECTFPDRKDKVLNRVRAMRDGKLSDATFGQRMRGRGEWARLLNNLFKLSVKKHNLNQPLPPFDVSQFRRLAGGQMGLFS